MALDTHFEQARQRVQVRPNDLGARSALWQIFASRGEFARARTQLNAMVAIDSSWTLEAQACEALLKAEETRLEVLAGRRAPVCLGEPPPWFADLVAGLAELPAGPVGQVSGAARLLKAQQASQACAGLVNGQPFAWVCDGDARLGPCLELMVRGQYFWVPWSRLRAISTRPPTELRDRLWLHALVTLEDENAIEAFLPARYPGPRDDAEHLGEMTHWAPLAEADAPDAAAFRGFGQKTQITDTGEYGLLDIRELTLQPAA
ncbi:MAG: type VI secretion system accessory protein TagJ [Rubrivivax sp.]